MLDVLSELVRGNKASIALNSLRSLLRTKPDNKRVWELIALAYQQLGQPQQLKIAYQHYLNYFPSEPAAILGLISCFAEEQNLAEALSLLDTYEATLISAGFIYQVEQIYTGLDKIDPINIRVLEGLIRVATAADNQDNVRTLTSKLQSLRTVTGLENNYPTNPAAQPAASNEQPFFVPDTDVTPFSDEIPSNDITIPGFDVIVYEDHSEDESDIEPSGVTGDAILNHEDNGMIDIEIDLDATFDALDHDIGSSAEPAGWFDSVEDLFDSIDTAPSGIKFGNDMDVSDAESHFDLGQAFKEMGLLDEAINEFRQSSQDPTRRVASLIMQCACLRERGELEKATSMLLALLKSGITEEESCAVKYELATGYELAGNKEEAATYLNEINASNPEFRDIRSRLDTAKHSDALDFSDEELKEFELK
jgi:tetratricopeptide (TPR) repeat protein